MQKFILLLLSYSLCGFALAGPVDVNSADAETIAQELNGVGRARARAIVKYREQNGAFESADELLNVTGIGEHTLEANRTNILVERADP